MQNELAQTANDDLIDPLEGLEEFEFEERQRPNQDRIISSMTCHQLLSPEEEIAMGNHLVTLRQQVRSEVFRQPITIIFILSDDRHCRHKDVTDLRESLQQLRTRWHDLRGNGDFLQAWQAEVSSHTHVVEKHVDKMSGKKGVTSAFKPLDTDYRFPRLMTLWRGHVQEFETLLSSSTGDTLIKLRTHEDAVLMPAGEFLGSYRRTIEAGLQYATIRERFAQSNMKIVAYFAKRFAPAGDDYFDLITPAALGLYSAIDRFDPSFGVKFSTFAAYQIRASIRRDRHEHQQTIRLPENVVTSSSQLLKKSRELFPDSATSLVSLRDAGAALGWKRKKVERAIQGVQARNVASVGESDLDESDVTPSFSYVLDNSPIAREGTDSEEPSHQLEVNEDHLILRNLLSILLRPREINVMRLRYGLSIESEGPDLADNPLTLQGVGDVIGLTRERVRQVQAEAETILRSAQVLLAASPEKLKIAINAIGANGDKEALVDILDAKTSGQMRINQDVGRDLVRRLASFLVFQNAGQSLMVDLAFKNLRSFEYSLLLSLNEPGKKLGLETAFFLGDSLIKLQSCYTEEHYRNTMMALSRDNSHGKIVRGLMKPKSINEPPVSKETRKVVSESVEQEGTVSNPPLEIELDEVPQEDRVPNDLSLALATGEPELFPVLNESTQTLPPDDTIKGEHPSDSGQVVENEQVGESAFHSSGVASIQSSSLLGLPAELLGDVAIVQVKTDLSLSDAKPKSNGFTPTITARVHSPETRPSNQPLREKVKPSITHPQVATNNLLAVPNAISEDIIVNPTPTPAKLNDKSEVIKEVTPSVDKQAPPSLVPQNLTPIQPRAMPASTEVRQGVTKVKGTAASHAKFAQRELTAQPLSPGPQSPEVRINISSAWPLPFDRVPVSTRGVRRDVYEMLHVSNKVEWEVALEIGRVLRLDQVEERLSIIKSSGLSPARYATLLAHTPSELPQILDKLLNKSKAQDLEVTESLGEFKEDDQNLPEEAEPLELSDDLPEHSEHEEDVDSQASYIELSDGDLNELWTALKSDKSNESLRNAIATRYIEFSQRIASLVARRLPGNINAEDLYGAAAVGLLEAIDDYEPERGFRFETFASFRLRGAIFDEIRELDLIPRLTRSRQKTYEGGVALFYSENGYNPNDEELGAFLKISLPDVIRMRKASQMGQPLTSLDRPVSEQADDSSGAKRLIDLVAPVSDEIGQAFEVQDFVERIVAELPLRDRTVVNLYMDGWAQKRIGEVHGVSESRMSQILSEIRDKIVSKFPDVFPRQYQLLTKSPDSYVAREHQIPDDVLHEALLDLPPQHRIFVTQYLEGVPRKRIAELNVVSEPLISQVWMKFQASLSRHLLSDTEPGISEGRHTDGDDNGSPTSISLEFNFFGSTPIPTLGDEEEGAITSTPCLRSHNGGKSPEPVSAALPQKDLKFEFFD